MSGAGASAPPRSRGASAPPPSPGASAPPPLGPFGLLLHHDGGWSHEGQPIRHERLRAAFDRGVRWLPAERKYVVQVGCFRGEIEVEEAAFFVRDIDLARAALALSDGSREHLDPATLALSPRDGALLCRVKPALEPGGLLARFGHAAQAELLLAVEETPAGLLLPLGGVRHSLPTLVPARA